MIFFLRAIAVGYLGSIAVVHSESERERVCLSPAEARETILTHGLSEPFRAMRGAASRLQAEPIGVQLCRRRDELVYEMSLLRHDGRVLHVFIDAKTGQAIASKNEN